MAFYIPQPNLHVPKPHAQTKYFKQGDKHTTW